MKSKKSTEPEGEVVTVPKASRKKKTPETEKKITPSQRSDKSSRDLLDAVASIYDKGGWQLLRGRGITDLIAAKDSKYHFIQVLNIESTSDPKFNGEQRNMFIQNAFANSATPVYAYVQAKQVTSENGERYTQHNVTFRDINTGGRIIIRAKNNEV